MYSFILFAVLSYGVLESHGVHGSLYGYHERVGVPKAKWLLFSESLRIVGGSQVASELVVPHQAGIIATLTTGWQSVCGGSLISTTRVLTAAHCWYDGQHQSRHFTIVLGSVLLYSGGTRQTTSDVIVHPNWNPNEVTFDIAVARIQSVALSNSIQAIPLPTMSDAAHDFSGLTATVSGYGKTSDAQTSFPTTTSLYQTTVSIVTNDVCQRNLNMASIHGSHLCTSGANGVGTCDGDSGGPLTVVWNNRRTLVGVVSFGPDVGCQLGHPSVYSRVTAFLGWIQAQL